MTRPVLRTDGGARGNPGPAGAGFVIHVDGETVCGAGRFLGSATNNVAEYEALIWGLENVQALGFREVSVRADSELVVKQIRGEYRVKNAGLKPLFLKALALLRSFEAWDIAHVRRADNAEADALANEAMDARATVGAPAACDAGESSAPTLF